MLCLAVAWKCFEPGHDVHVDLWWNRRSGPRIQLVRLGYTPSVMQPLLEGYMTTKLLVMLGIHNL